MGSKWVRMRHPKLKDQPIVVAESAVPVHERSGWRRADKQRTEKQEEVSNDGATGTDE